MDVWIRPSRVRSLLTSAIEVYNRETDGLFSGSFVLRKIRGRKRTVLYVDSTYSFQTAERKPSEVFHGNIAAFRRATHSLTSADIEFLGGYHSHPFPYRGVKLSKSDVDFIKDELDFIRKSRHFRTQDRWVELLMCIKRKKYERKQKTGWKFRRAGKRVRFFLTISPYAKYEIILAAFCIDFLSKKPKISEARIHVPWMR